MERIASFNVNHDTLEKGMYISRIDGDIVTYDIRMKKPNMGDYVSMRRFIHSNIYLQPTRGTARFPIKSYTLGLWDAGLDSTY